MKPILQTMRRVVLVASLAAGSLGWSAAGATEQGASAAQTQAQTQAQPQALPQANTQAQALRRASDAVVGLRALAVDDARSAATLGRSRQGSGVVIGDDGLVLTIGYLVLEAEQVLLSTDDGRHVPARVVAYDLATGFGLVQALVPLRLQPVPLAPTATAPAADPQSGQPLLVVTGGDSGGIGATRLVSRRAFAGYWEYHLEGALFTSPPHREHSGAALFNEHGELLGIGSLFVADALGPDRPRSPGNMFVPVELLKPILAELRERGSSGASKRAWMGVNCAEHEGQLRVLRVAEDSPADLAGVLAGDRVLGLDGQQVSGLAQLWQTLWADPRAEREVALDIERAGRRLTLKLQTVDRAQTLRKAKGV